MRAKIVEMTYVKNMERNYIISSLVYNSHYFVHNCLNIQD